jgi:3-mercaptopyruvate sulfurtransferase SseA
MVATISRDELKEKIERGDKFALVETLPRTTYDHAHLPGAINLPPDVVVQLAPALLPGKSDWIDAGLPTETAHQH